MTRRGTSDEMLRRTAGRVLDWLIQGCALKVLDHPTRPAAGYVTDGRHAAMVTADEAAMAIVDGRMLPSSHRGAWDVYTVESLGRAA